MKYIKRFCLMMTVAMIGFALLTGEAMAYSDAYFNFSGSSLSLKFTAAGGGSIQNSKFTFMNTGGMRIDSAYIPQMGGLTDQDPLVGAYVSIFSPGGTGQFTVGSQYFGGGINTWNIVDSTATIKVSSAAGGAGINYFTGTLTPLTIDLNTGYINWGLSGTLATYNNTINSEILGILGNSDNDPHYAVLGNMSYYHYDAVANFLLTGGTGATRTEGFGASVTVVPEPGEWALILAGLGLIGFSIHRRGGRFEMPETFNLRMS
jgi:hypothetical protein